VKWWLPDRASCWVLNGECNKKQDVWSIFEPKNVTVWLRVRRAIQLMIPVRRTETKHKNVIDQFDELHDWRSDGVISNDRLAKRSTGTPSWCGGEVLGIGSPHKKWWIGRRGAEAHPSAVTSFVVRRFVQEEIIKTPLGLWEPRSQCGGSLPELPLTASRDSKSGLFWNNRRTVPRWCGQNLLYDSDSWFTYRNSFNCKGYVTSNGRTIYKWFSKDVEGSYRDLFQGTNQVVPWRNWGKSREESARIVGLTADIGTGDSKIRSRSADNSSEPFGRFWLLTSCSCRCGITTSDTDLKQISSQITSQWGLGLSVHMFHFRNYSTDFDKIFV